MNPMLATIFLSVFLGMVATRWRLRLYPLSLLLGALLTAVYLFLPRYM